MKFLDVSHPIEAGMKTYPGLPEPVVVPFVDYEESRSRYGGLSEFYIASLHLCGNTGTYVDAPIHRYRGGACLAQLPLEKLAHVPTVVVRPRGEIAITHEAFRGLHVAGKAVLVDTGWSAHWRTEAYFGTNPHLTADACKFLLDAGVSCVGIDSVNIDSLQDLVRPAHTLLLGAGVPICEHMCRLEEAPDEGGYFHAVPVPWVGGATFPVRAYIMTEESKR